MYALPPVVIAFAERGWMLTPLRRNGKEPLLKEWRTVNRTSNLDQIQQWNQTFPGCNYGVVTGSASNLCVLDVDTKNGKQGLEWQNRQSLEHGVEWLDTLRVRTASGGYHNYYQWSEGIGKNTSGLIANGVDVIGEGGQVVCPGSVVNGVVYRFEGCDAEKDILPLPQWVLPDLRKQSEPEPRWEQPTNGAAKIPSGQRHQFLLTHAGQLLRWGIGLKALVTQLMEVNFGKFQEPYAEQEILRQANDFYQRWQKDPAALFREFFQNRKVEKEKAAIVDARLLGRWLNDVEERDVEWLRSPDVPMGALTLLSGDPGAGKTWLALDLSKQVTDSGRVVLYLTIENPAEEVLKPRFRSLGGDVSKLRIIDGVEFRNAETGEAEVRSVTLQDLVILEREIEQITPGLVVVDPIQSYLGANIDAHRSNETRPVLDGLIRLAQRYRFAPFVLRHCAKNGTGKALYRGIGTIDFTAAARSELLAVEMSPGKFAMAHVKSNLGMKGVTREYSIQSEKDGVISKAGVFTWGAQLDLSANDLIAEDRIDHRLQEAEDWLKEKLADGAVLTVDLIEDAKQSGVSERTLKRAKKKLGVQAYKRVDHRWEWFIPGDDDRRRP